MQSLQDHFLIAMPAMADPNFNETVTYICKHDAEGAFGLVITRPSDLSLGEMLGQLAIELKDRRLAERPVMHGGPVEPERGFVLHRSDIPFEATLADVFAHTAVLTLGPRSDVTRETFLLVASDAPLLLEDLRDDLARRLEVVRYGATDLQALRARSGGLVLTDDFAPVEALLAPVVRRSGD